MLTNKQHRGKTTAVVRPLEGISLYDLPPVETVHTV